MIQIKRQPDGTHTVDREQWVPCGLREYKKKVATWAVQMREAFSVETLEGTMEGKDGDWLMSGVQGELYPCDRAIFEETYEEAK